MTVAPIVPTVTPLAVGLVGPAVGVGIAVGIGRAVGVGVAGIDSDGASPGDVDGPRLDEHALIDMTTNIASNDRFTSALG